MGPYCAECRHQALERMKTCNNVKVLARELGVARQHLYWWKQRAEQRANPRKPGATEDPRDRRMRELTKKVAELEGVVSRDAHCQHVSTIGESAVGSQAGESGNPKAGAAGSTKIAFPGVANRRVAGAQYSD